MLYQCLLLLQQLKVLVRVPPMRDRSVFWSELADQSRFWSNSVIRAGLGRAPHPWKISLARRQLQRLYST